MCKKLTIVIALIAITLSYSKNVKTLKTQLLEYAHNTITYLDGNIDNEGNLDPHYGKEEIDIPNGFLKAETGDGPCGCTSFLTVAAYKDSKNEYTFLSQEFFNCADNHLLSANRKMSQILPPNFGIKTYMKKNSFARTYVIPLFYLRAELPQYGTKTKVSIHLIPERHDNRDTSIIQFESWPYSEDENEPIVNMEDYPKTDSILNNRMRISDIVALSTCLKESKTFVRIALKQEDNISEDEKKRISEFISQHNMIPHKDYISFSQLRHNLSFYHEVYEIYKQLSHSYVLLRWNKKMSRFKIDSFGPPPKQYKSFIDFLRHYPEWNPIC